MKKILVALLLLSSFAFAQGNLDSLEQLVKTKKGKEKVVLLNDLCWYLGASDPNKAERYGKEAVKISKELKNDSLLAQSHNDLGTLYLRIGQYEEALKYYAEAVNIRTLLKDTMGTAAVFSKMAVIEELRANYSNALDINLKVLKLYEGVGTDKFAIATVNGNICVILGNMGQVDKALKFNDKAFEISKELNNPQLYATTLVNYANLYRKKEELDKSLTHYKEALPLFEELNNINSVAVVLNNMASIYEIKNQLDSALTLFEKSLDLRYRLQDKKGIMSTKASLATVYLKKNKADLALQFALEALPVSIELETKDNTKTIYGILSKAYAIQGNYLRAYENQEEYIRLLDTLYSEASSKQVAEMSTKYESEKKEQEILLLQKDNQLQEAEMDRIRKIRNIVIGGIIIILLFVVVLINRFVLIKRQKTIIEKQKEIVEEKQKEILDSIRYAKRIQDALLTSQGYIERNIKRLRG